MKTNQTLQRIALPMLIFLSLFANSFGNTYAYHAFHHNTLPDSIPIASRKNFHIQGIAMDKEHHYFYVSYTTQLVKYDLNGKEVGSVDNLLGHLGCIAYNPKDGKVYGSLEYKNDEIGRGISNKAPDTDSRRLSSTWLCSRLIRSRVRLWTVLPTVSCTLSVSLR